MVNIMKSLRLGLFALLFLVGPNSLSFANDPLNDLRPLTGEEIRKTFRNVKDHAQVQDKAKTRATNLWLDDGQFTSTWRNDRANGIVSGKWYVQEGQRCVIIETGLPDLTGKPRCGAIYRQGDRYFTVNLDGSIHGIHQLSPLHETE
jgi:hypothetical protein